MLHSHEYAATAEELALVGISIAMDKTVELEITKDGDVAVAAFKSGCISDVEGITAAGRQIKQFVNDNRSSKLVFDFAEVKFKHQQLCTSTNVCRLGWVSAHCSLRCTTSCWPPHRC